MSTFITGGTGFLGRYLVAALLQEKEYLYLHVRCQNKSEGMQRIKASLEKLDGFNADVEGLVSIIPGDLRKPYLGVSSEDQKNVTGACERYLHCAASVRFDMPLDEARAINVGGTKGVLDLARVSQDNGILDRVDIVSTAYVAGKQVGLVKEQQHESTYDFKNTYEQSKHEAEVLAWNAMEMLPICILRPSIVVGEAAGGRTSNFNTIYSLVQVYARGMLRFLPANKKTPIDLVPVDYVRDVILAVQSRPDSIGQCFHVTAGPENVLCVEEIVEIVESFFPQNRKIRYQPVGLWQELVIPCLTLMPFRKLRTMVRVLRAYIPYIKENPIYSDAKIRKILSESDISTPDVRDYIQKILQYAVVSDFGRSA